MIGSLAHAEVPSLDAEGFARLRRLDDYCRGQAQVAPAAILRGVVELSLRIVGPSRPLLVAWADALARRARSPVNAIKRAPPLEAGLLRAAAGAFASVAAEIGRGGAEDATLVGDLAAWAEILRGAAADRGLPN